MAVLSSSVISFDFCLLLVTTFISQASANTEIIQEYNTEQNYHYCSDFNHARGNYTPNSIYQTNLNTLWSNLTTNTEFDYGFYNSSFGENTESIIHFLHSFTKSVYIINSVSFIVIS